MVAAFRLSVHHTFQERNNQQGQHSNQCLCVATPNVRQIIDDLAYIETCYVHPHTGFTLCTRRCPGIPPAPSRKGVGGGQEGCK